MKKILFLLFVTFASIGMAEVNPRLVLQQNESKDLQIGELGSLGLIAYIGGDSIMLLDDPGLEVVKLNGIENPRQILLTDSALFCSIDNYVCRFDTVSNSLEDIMILDNNEFSLYPACGNSFFVVTADDEWSDCFLVDPENDNYSEVLQFPGLIRKVVASKEHCFVWLEDNICLVGEDQVLANLLNDPSIRDVVLTSSGLVMANDDGLWVIETPSKIHNISDAKIERLWYVEGSLYILGENGTLIALDDFVYPEKE